MLRLEFVLDLVGAGLEEVATEEGILFGGELRAVISALEDALGAQLMGAIEEESEKEDSAGRHRDVLQGNQGAAPPMGFDSAGAESSSSSARERGRLK